ncbi:hypothetical protein NCAS_0A07960 [Naumovozyma castellii]|uniref:Mitochondrial fusion and transport protein UGO1 n=1 Tax=Naumovozyma castellii TaxID=27288 RepID=G0V7A6_NAUCA|nr:hypothetical protein NCAS_0A07960 [Naumovozyma castellii CBS 4309]CCC67354.1 hypothetical protein NCAS_0A07960 [Naumovozyma castellii CBS 4309]
MYHSERERNIAAEKMDTNDTSTSTGSIIQSGAQTAISRAQTRPYYDPNSFNIGLAYSSVFNPEKGVIDNNGFSIASKLSIVKKNSNSGSNVKDLFVKGRRSSSGGTDGRQGAILWDDFINFNKWERTIKQIVRNLFNVYFNHFIQQPFEVAKIIMQVIDPSIPPSSSSTKPITMSDNEDDISETEDIDYFPVKKVESSIDNEGENQTVVPSDHTAIIINPNLISPASLKTMDILNVLIDKEGLKGLWRANHTTFILNFLGVSINSWLVSLLSSLVSNYFFSSPHSSISTSLPLALPITSSFKSLILINLTAAILTNLVLIPMDLIKLRLIVTSTMESSNKRRSLRRLITKWSWRNDGPNLPISIWFNSILKSIVTVTFGTNFDILIYSKFNLDKFTNWKIFYSFKFISKCVELFIKLPIETILRRSQLNYLLNYQNNLQIQEAEQNQSLIIKPNLSTNFSKQLWNGWKISLISLCCGYGFRMLNKIDDDLKLELEKF